MNNLYAISLDLRDKKCLVVGGGQVAERKIRSLMDCGARVHVVGPELSRGVKDLAEAGLIIFREGKYEADDLKDVFLVIAATDQEEVNRQVAEDCESANLLVNIVDDPGKGNFFVPSVVQRGSLKIAISTGGKSPLLARRLREDLELVYGPQFGEYLEYLGELRGEVMISVTGQWKRRDILESMIDEEVIRLLKEGRTDAAKERTLRAYRSSRFKP